MTYCLKLTGKGKPVHSLIGNIIIKLFMLIDNQI